MNSHSTSFQRVIAAIAVVAAATSIARAQRPEPSEWKWVDPHVAEGCDHHTLFSPSMQREIGYSIYLPPSYASSGDRRYPVVYYLHGAGGSESSSREFAWAVQSAIADDAIHEVIYVFPNGGHFSGYRDREDGSVMAETWIIGELIPHIDATYRTISTRDGRALCGWSMGGGGAMRFLMKYPEKFCAAATMAAALGSRGRDPNDSAESNLRRNIEQLRGNIGVWMAVGEDDRLKAGNESFSSKMTELGIDHSLRVLPGVGHNLGALSGEFHREIVLMLDRQLNGGQESSDSEQTTILHDLAYKSDAPTDYERERCKLDWYLPNDAEGFPTIVWFHGGGLQNGDKAGEVEVGLARRFAREGIAVASVNYRLSPRAAYPAYVDDAAAAVAYVIEHTSEHGGDASQVFVSGHSAGGYLAAMVGMNPDLLDAHELTRKSPAGYIPVSGQMITHSTVRGERGVSATQPVIDQAAPAFYATSDTAPFLCIAGDHDLPARSEENRYFVAAMQAAGHEFIEFHEFSDRDHSTIANQMNEPNDAVALAIKDFISLRAEAEIPSADAAAE